MTIGQNFDGPDLIWQLTGRTGRILDQTHVPDGARDQAGCERLVVAAPVGESAICDCRVVPVAVLDELKISVWVKASRPDVRLAARVTMPRSADAEGRPAAAVVRGVAYSRPGRWQQLVLKAVPELLAAEVRVMRTQPGAKVDPRQAYIDSILLVVPGEPNGVEIFTDDLEVDGVTIDGPPAVQLATFPEDSAAPTPPSFPISDQEKAQEAVFMEPAQLPQVRLQGSVLLVEGKPFVPRAVEWQNEPFKRLAELGFNTVWLPSLPTAELIAEASRHGLWFICSPPRIDAIIATGIGQPGDRVIAWIVNDAAVELNPQYYRQWADAIRQHDAGNRPIMLVSYGRIDFASDTADIELASHSRAASMPLADYHEWLGSRLRAARPGMPLWVAIPTQLGQQASQQASALSGALSLPPSVDADQIAALVHTAWTGGCRGILFRSETPLDDGSSPTHQRAALIELTNHRLQLVEPWIASGKLAGQVASMDATWQGIMLHVDRARLLVPTRGGQLTPAGVNSTSVALASHAEVAIVVPGVPASSEAYQLSPAVMRPLALNRVAGGTRIRMPANPGSMVLITEDLQIIQSFRQRIARDAPQVARLQRDLVTERARAAADVERNLAQLGFRSDTAPREEALVAGQLRQCNLLMTAGRAGEAYEAAESANQALWRAATEQRRAIRPAEGFISHPLLLSSDQLVMCGKFLKSSASLRPGENLLYGGDFEDLGQMTQFGWVHVNRAMLGIDAQAKLSVRQPRIGQLCLELSAAPDASVASQDIVKSPPVWIVSPPVPIAEGQVVEITGWVRIDTPIAGSIDGLQIADSLGGPELSLALRKTSGWQLFQMTRGVPQSAELRVTFALAGIGSACIDGVMIRTLNRPTIRRLPPVSPTVDSSDSSSAITDNTAEKTGPLFVTPAAR